MTALASYSTGTVSVSAGGTTVTGTGTIWSGVNARPGDILQIGNFQTIISDVVDVDTLTIPSWGGGAQTDVAYTIWKVSPQRFAGAQAMADVNKLVAALNTNGVPVIVPPGATEPDPSLGEEDQYAIQPGAYKFWLKTGGLWVYQGTYKGLQLKGAWDGGTAYAAGDVVTLSGSSYVCVSDHTNHTPPNTTYWQLLAIKGTDGNDGAAATVSVGTTTTGAGGSAASVTNSGTPAAAVFDFTIPAGKSYGGTSTTSLAIGAGSQAFATQAGLAYQDGARVRASSAANTSNWLEGLATYSDTTLTITVDKFNGSGTHDDWIFNVVGQPGAGDLSSANNLSDLANAATAAINLGVVRYGGSQSLTAAQQKQARNNLNLGTGAILGMAIGTYASNTGLSATIPLDDTIPQSTEGTQIISVSYTPKAADSTLLCVFNGQVFANPADSVVVALFNGAANAFAAEMMNSSGARAQTVVAGSYSPGSTSQQTISVRVGAGSATTYLNGTNSGRFLGGSSVATLTIYELSS
ncbi:MULTISPECIES: carbohydrate-binding protein [Bradyrhizobium]|uniref:carbohydrate-binding protein n=1 Tax=Bradyrhizobium TaxID=374 RepID=UPI0004AE23E8|nr:MULTISPECIES: carbohydrate-binding protein [unclassified Bradyrhizobium]MDA9425670.1 hypothetical protein [Bradyrhizobium sp. CCBAU 53380]